MPNCLWVRIPRNILIFGLILCIVSVLPAFATDDGAAPPLDMTIQSITGADDSSSGRDTSGAQGDVSSPETEVIQHESPTSLGDFEQSSPLDESLENSETAISPLDSSDYDVVDYMTTPDFMGADTGNEPKKDAPKSVRDWKLLVGDWNESNFPQNKGDFNFIFTQLSYKKVHFRYDLYTGSADRYRRYWLHYGGIALVSEPDVKLSITPGVMLLTDSKSSANSEAFYGGMLTLEFPKIRFSVQQRSYVGDGRLGRWGLHYTFSDLGVTKWLNLSHVWWRYQNALPASYLGPKLNLKFGDSCSFFGMYGFSIYDQRPNARFIYTGLTISF